MANYLFGSSFVRNTQRDIYFFSFSADFALARVCCYYIIAAALWLAPGCLHLYYPGLPVATRRLHFPRFSRDLPAFPAFPRFHSCASRCALIYPLSESFSPNLPLFCISFARILLIPPHPAAPGKGPPFKCITMNYAGAPEHPPRRGS